MPRVGWSTDQTAAYLYDDQGRVTHRWIQGRPDISTFDPFTYGYGQGQAAQGGQIYNAWQGGGGGYGGNGGYGDPGGYYYPKERTELDLEFDRLDLDYRDRQEARDAYQRQFDEEMAARERELAQQLEIARMNIASSEGMQKYEWEQRFKQLEQEHQYAVQYLQLDWAERHKAADKDLAMRLREIQGQERIQAAQTWANPMDYLAYNKWMQGEQAATTESGLPPGAPGWQTGVPEQAVGPGGVPTADIYGQQLAEGGRIQEFGAWGGPTGPVGGTPWISPHKVNVSQFANMPGQAQEMAYARWRQRGVMPGSAQQAMYAAAPTGGAQGAPGYG